MNAIPLNAILLNATPLRIKCVHYCIKMKLLNRLIAFDLSKQTKIKDPQQINFIGKLSKNTGATMFFIIEKSEETTFNFLQNSITII